MAIGSSTPFREPIHTIDMADAAVTLTAADLVGEILFVDANSASSENLLLPPEADWVGSLTIVNTGGETINLQNDAGGAVLTIATAEIGVVFCNGTTIYGYTGVA